MNVPTLEVDRGRLDPPNFTAVVQEHESETGLYTLGTRAGTLNTRFSRNQFNLMNQKFLTTADVPEDVTLSVREAACLHSNTGGQGFLKCLCQTAWLTKKCKCIRDSVKCNFRCHKNCSCQNHDNALIQRNPFPSYRVSSFIGSQKLVSACGGSNRLVSLIIPHHQNCNVHLYH